MSNEFDYDERQLVPRLVTLRTANQLFLNKTSSISKEMNDFENNNFNKLISEWNYNKFDLDLCIDILSYKIIFDEITIPSEIIKILNNNTYNLNQSQLELFNLYSSNDSTESKSCIETENDIGKRIHDIRNSNNNNNRNPLLWCDMGYYYTILGLKEKARQCYFIAYNLNNSNRHVIRSVSRFYIHIDEPEIALSIIRESPNIKNDVGLLSAEIAISELIKTRSKYIDCGRRKIKDDNISYFEKNELLAQIASLEFQNGKSKIGKKLVKDCLKGPNENSLAQFEFLKKHYVIDGDFESQQFKVLCNHEALARNYLINNNYKKSLDETSLWIKFQPFSLQPACYGSFLAASFLEDYNKSIEICKRALKLSPTDFTVLNNYAFSLAHLNKVKEAIDKVNLIKINNLADFENSILNATKGLIQIKNGDVEEGKQLYEKAINYFIRQKDFTTLARAKYNYGKALIVIDKQQSEKLIIESLNLARKYNIHNLYNLIMQRYF